MSRPWMPLYIADYRKDTGHLSAAEHGAYLLLIMHYWATGGLPDDDKQLARIACMSPSQWKRARPIIVPFFRDGWKHARIDEELAHAAVVSSKRRAAADHRHGKSDANAPPNADQLQTQSQSPPPSPVAIGNFRRAGEGKPSGPRHGATSQKHGTTFIRFGTKDWETYSDDHRQAHGWVPEPNEHGGYWFKTAGAAPLPIPKRLSN